MSGHCIQPCSAFFRAEGPASAALHIEVLTKMFFQVVELMFHKACIGAVGEQSRTLLRSNPVGKDDDMDMGEGLFDRSEQKELMGSNLQKLHFSSKQHRDNIGDVDT